MKCDFTMQCHSLNGRGHEGPYPYKFEPKKDAKGVAPLQKYEPGFQVCVDAQAALISSDAGVENTQFAIDDVVIAYRKP